MVVYAVAANVSIIQIFLAGFLPGLLVMALYSGYIAVWSLAHPQRTPPADPPMPFREKLRESAKLVPLMAADRARVPVAADGLGDRDRMRRLGRARLARDRVVARHRSPGRRSGRA